MERIKRILLITIFLILLMFLQTTISNAAEISSRQFEIDEEAKTISKIPMNATVEEVKAYIASEEEIKIFSKEGYEVGNSHEIRTGMVLRAGEEEYSLSITGDTSGDGKRTVVDIAQVKMHLVDIRLLEGIYLKAADINYDNVVNVVDLSRLKLVVLELLDIDSNLKVEFSEDGNKEYKKVHKTKVTVTDLEGNTNRITTLKYKWSKEAVAPEEIEFENTFENGGEIVGEGLTGSYYLWILGKDLEGNKIITRSKTFNFDNEAPEIELSINPEGWTTEVEIIIETEEENLYKDFKPIANNGGIVEEISSEGSPVKGAKTWRLVKTGEGRQLHGLQGAYDKLFVGKKGDRIIISGYYKTENAAGIERLGLGEYTNYGWKEYQTETIRIEDEIIEDGIWHYFCK